MIVFALIRSRLVKIRKFNTEGHAAWKSFYNEVFLEIKKEAKGSKITTEDIKKGYNKRFRKKGKVNGCTEEE